MYSTQTDVKKYSTLIEVRHVHYTDWRGRERGCGQRMYSTQNDVAGRKGRPE